MKFLRSIKQKIFNRGPYDPLILSGNRIFYDSTKEKKVDPVGKPRGLSASKIWQDMSNRDWRGREEGK